MDSNLISVIIPTYNRFTFLKNAIDSVLAQTFQEFELIVVDDGSTDETPKLISSYGNKLRVITQANQGPSAARNRGIEAAKGKWIAFLDSDDVWKLDKLEKQVQFIKDHPETKICQTEETWIRNEKRVNPRKKHEMHSGWIYEKCLPLFNKSFNHFAGLHVPRILRQHELSGAPAVCAVIAACECGGSELHALVRRDAIEFLLVAYSPACEGIFCPSADFNRRLAVEPVSHRFKFLCALHSPSQCPKSCHSA